MSFRDKNRPANPRHDYDFVAPEWKDPGDPASWEQEGGPYHRGGSLPTGVGDAGGTGMGALLVIGGIWLLYEYAGKRAS